jgi:hypothetical protein
MRMRAAARPSPFAFRPLPLASELAQDRRHPLEVKVLTAPSANVYDERAGSKRVRTAFAVIVLLALGGCTLREQTSPATGENRSALIAPPPHPSDIAVAQIPVIVFWHEVEHVVERPPPNGSFPPIEPMWVFHPDCGDGIHLDHRNRTVVAGQGGNATGPIPVAVLQETDWRRESQTTDHTIVMEFPFTRTIWLADRTFNLTITSSGAWFDGGLLFEGATSERAIEKNGTRTTLGLRYEGLWTPPRGSQFEWGCD